MTTVCARSCAHTGLHKRSCASGADCSGCLPREAVTGRWCSACMFRVRGDLVDLPALAALVGASVDGSLNAAPPPVSDAPRAPSPASRTVSPAFDEADEVERWLHSWTDLICEQLALEGPARYSVAAVPVPDADACTRFLLEWLSWPAEHEPLQFYDEVTRLHRQLVRSTGSDEYVERVTEACPRCDLRMMTREDGSDSVVCGNEDCRAVYRSEEWARRVGSAA